MIPKIIIDRFNNRYIPTTESGCWIWDHDCDGKGYGRISYRNSRYSAHRMSWMIHHGAIEPGLNVLHKCDVTFCVNPDHLFLGTQKDNMGDCARKKRHQFGERSGASVLTDEMAQGIHSAHGKYKDIAARFGISKYAVKDIKKRNRWRHLELSRCGHNYTKGSDVTGSKLSESEVLEIRRATGSFASLARMYGVSDTSIANIKRRKTWAWLPD
jgi:hypothetical protein